MGTLLKIKFSTIDDIVERIVKFKGNCLLYKIDLQRAFRHLKLDPKDINKTGLKFDKQFYVEQPSDSDTFMGWSVCRG